MPQGCPAYGGARSATSKKRHYEVQLRNEAARCDILTDSLTYCRDPNGLKIYGWVILDSHFHAILAAPDLSRTLAVLKRYTARRLLDPLEAENCEWLLHQFEFCRAAHEEESRHPWASALHAR